MLELKSLLGRSLPSLKYGAWIVDKVSKTIQGRSRLVTGNLKGVQCVWTHELVEMFNILDEEKIDEIPSGNPDKRRE